GALPPYDLWFLSPLNAQNTGLLSGRLNTPYSNLVGGGAQDQFYVSMFVVLLPFLDEDARAFAIRTGNQYNCRSHVNFVYTKALPRTFICPSDGSNPGETLVANWSPGDYAGNFLIFGNPRPTDIHDPVADGVWGTCAKLPGDIPDGVSNTFFLTEKY